MGFFSQGPATTVQRNTYDNPELRQYTAQYRSSAPWTFMTLDPTATLASMRSQARKNSPNWDANGKYIGSNVNKKYLQGLADDEQMERDAANDSLERIKKRQESGEFLTPQETEFISTQLDKAFEYAQTTGMEQWERGMQAMAGGRGMRTSDTPAADPAARELRNLQLGLGSERAKMQLGATLEFSKNQQEFDANYGNMMKQLGQNRWAARQGFMFGQGMQGAANLGYTNTQTTTQYSPSMSGFQKVMAGFQMMSASQAMGTNFATMGMTGTPSSSVGGSTYGGSQGWGESMGGMSGVMSGAGSMMSDRRLKKDIRRIGTHDLGIGIYSYTIAGQHQIGVMADEVKTVKPEAVTRTASGYDMVHYGLL